MMMSELSLRSQGGIPTVPGGTKTARLVHEPQLPHWIILQLMAASHDTTQPVVVTRRPK
jgi:hypothetical protein